VTTLAAWLSAFRILHEKARKGTLVGIERDDYHAGRDELARALLAAQRLTVAQGQPPRQAIRVARALQLDLDLLTSRERAITLDLSTGGFSCLLAKAPPLGDEARFSLRLPGAEALSGHARVTDAKPNAGNVRVSFQMIGLSPEERERVELFVFDTLLAQLAP
jgi:PilZ domain-containing protein